METSNIVSLSDYRRLKSPPSQPPKSLSPDTVLYMMSKQIMDLTLQLVVLGEQLSTLREENETLAARVDGQRKLLVAMAERVWP